MIDRLHRWARALKRDVYALALAARDPRVPWPAKLLAIAVAGYALSPIDLIPDFIPVLGLLDDLVLVPLGIFLVLRLIPPAVMAELRERATDEADRSVARWAGPVVLALWGLGLALAAAWGWRAFAG